MATASSKRVYNSAAWKRARSAALSRAGRRCEECRGPSLDLEVHHVRPLAAGGAPFELGNLKCLCKPCHYAVKGGEREQSPGEVAWAQLVEGMA